MLNIEGKKNLQGYDYSLSLPLVLKSLELPDCLLSHYLSNSGFSSQISPVDFHYLGEGMKLFPKDSDENLF